MKARAIESPPLKPLPYVLIAWRYSPTQPRYASRDEMNISINGTFIGQSQTAPLEAEPTNFEYL